MRDANSKTFATVEIKSQAENHFGPGGDNWEMDGGRFVEGRVGDGDECSACDHFPTNDSFDVRRCLRTGPFNETLSEDCIQKIHSVLFAGCSQVC